MVFQFGLLFAMVLVATFHVVTWGLPLTGYEGQLAALRTEVFSRLEMIAEDHKQEILARIEEKQRRLQFVANDPNLLERLEKYRKRGEERDRDAVLDHLRGVVASFSNAEAVHLIAPDTGAVLLAAGPLAQSPPVFSAA
ncbi:MAG: hypothetical protein HQL57_08700, partial [Magnetococcales bacterium]|nr:hypothetical protein [Magnetococcales bacterium]